VDLKIGRGARAGWPARGVVDELIIRATRFKTYRLLRRAARASPFAIAVLPTRHPCYFGFDFPETNDLCRRPQVEQICAMCGADSVGYLLPRRIESALANAGNMLRCFTGVLSAAPSMWCLKHALERGGRICWKTFITVRRDDESSGGNGMRLNEARTKKFRAAAARFV
jgi:hypothetical protein